MATSEQRISRDRNLDYADPSWRWFSTAYNTATISASVLLMWAAMHRPVTPRLVPGQILFYGVRDLLGTPTALLFLTGIVSLIAWRRARYSPFVWLSVLLSCFAFWLSLFG